MDKRIWSFFLVLFLGIGTLSGCGVIDAVFLKPPQDTALELLQAGNSAMGQEDYKQAISYYTKLKDRYPFSPYTAQAELRLADAYFLDKRYAAAENAYKEFESLHPGHEDIAYVLFRIGLSNYKQFKSIDLP
ncbi:MAG: outer membrane protein assembly factor BamD, partial [Desulfovermiculus sp.]